MDNASTEISVKYCRHCGKELEEQSAFCSACGTAVVLEQKPKKNKPFIIPVIVGLVILSIIAVAVSVFLRPNETLGNITLNGPAYDPCNFLENPSLFDEPITYFLEGLTEGEDYEKKGGEWRTFYNLKLPSGFMKIENATLSFIFTEENMNSPVGSARYYFYPAQGDKSEDITAYMIGVLEKAFGSPTERQYMALDSLLVEELSEDEYFRKIKQDISGVYTVSWETEEVSATLYLYENEDEPDYGLLQFYPQ